MRRTLRIASLFIILFGCRPFVYGQQDPVVQRVFLVGDAGELKDGHHPVCDWLKQHVNWNDTSNTLVYLGDNIYPMGMPADGQAGKAMAEKVMDYQLSVVEGKGAKAYFVPGNHDWREGKPGGLQQEQNEEAYLASKGLTNVTLLPGGGCPGPVSVMVGEKIVLVGMDSQWWLEDPAERPGLESGCDCKDPKSIINGLKDIISTYPDKLILVAMHHPLYTHGPHGGYYTIKQHVFPLTDISSGLWIPLPVIGSIYPIVRGIFGNVQDVESPRYKELREQVLSVISGHSNVIHVAGHDHTLQLLQQDSVFYVVSGAGSRESRVKMGKYSLMAREANGFAVVEMRASGKSEIKFYTIDAKDIDQSFYTASVPQLISHVDTTEILSHFADSVTVAADSEFLAGSFKKFLLGHNYRKEWSIPIKVKVFDLTGWTPLQRGGGNETRSLRMRGPDGKEWVIRGVKKYVTPNALPAAVSTDQFVMDIVTDGVSASYPYAALSIPPFATALNVPHANPTLIYVPDDPRLGKFREDYGNLFAFIEEREPGNGKKTYNMDDLEARLKKDNDYTINQANALRARLLDMFVMDFDRHEDQWRWEQDANDKMKMLSPVPRDRDQPFFLNSGVIPYIAGSPWAAPQLQGFKPKARNIKTYNFNARNFDHNYLNELTSEQWRTDAEYVLSKMTDGLIDSALHLQPAPIYPYAMNSIIAKLKERRKYYMSDMMEYYRFLARTVSVFGSDKEEYFDVDRKGDSVTVTMSKLKDGGAGRTLYRRVFYASETKEVRLYGQGGDDKFHVHGDGGGGIVVRMIGGSGNDDFNNEATAAAGKTKIYDLSTEKNTIEGAGNYHKYLSSDPAVNAVNKLGFKYDVLTPMLDAGYNPDDGVLLGLSFRYVTQGFHKDPYATMQTLSGTHALATKAYDFKYTLDATHAVGKLDYLIHATVKAPENTINFFGFGNESVYLKDTKDGVRYYRARFNMYDADMQLRYKFGKLFSLAAGPAFQAFRMDSADNKDRFINQTGLNGLNGQTLYDSRTYLGGRATAIFDSRNDKIMPGRGIFWQTQFSSFGGLNDNSHQYSQLNSDLSLFASFNTRQNVVVATRAGWGRTFGTYEFYQAQFLGGTENLRGYRKFRFAGDESFYHNIDLRIKLAEFQTYFFPGSLGLTLFNDIGRVWYHGQSSDEWHDGYGAGLWISPLSKFVFSGNYARGSDGGVVLFKLGYQF